MVLGAFPILMTGVISLILFRRFPGCIPSSLWRLFALAGRLFDKALSLFLCLVAPSLRSTGRSNAFRFAIFFRPVDLLSKLLFESGFLVFPGLLPQLICHRPPAARPPAFSTPFPYLTALVKMPACLFRTTDPGFLFYS